MKIDFGYLLLGSLVLAFVALLSWTGYDAVGNATYEVLSSVEVGKSELVQYNPWNEIVTITVNGETLEADAEGENYLFIKWGSANFEKVSVEKQENMFGKIKYVAKPIRS